MLEMMKEKKKDLEADLEEIHKEITEAVSRYYATQEMFAYKPQLNVASINLQE